MSQNQFKVEAGNRAIDQMNEAQAKKRLRFMFRIAVENDQQLVAFRQAYNAQQKHIESLQEQIRLLRQCIEIFKPSRY